MVPDTVTEGHWLLRGIQSAVVFYVSCAPCVDQKYHKRRRKEAKQAHKEAEQEWKGLQIISTQPTPIRQPTAFQTNQTWAEEILLGPGPPKGWKPDELVLTKGKLTPDPTLPTPARLALRGFTVRGLPSEKWRYEREDEVLSGLGDIVTKLLDKVTSSEPTGRKRAATNDSDRDYSQGRNPDVNDLHPPVNTRLPASREESAWMKFATPSRAVMEGRERPSASTPPRRPMCLIGTPWERIE